MHDITPVKHRPNRATLLIAGAAVLLLASTCVLVTAGAVIMGTNATRGGKAERPDGTTIRAAVQPTPRPHIVIQPPEQGMDYETSVLRNIYEQVNPSVVNITLLSRHPGIEGVEIPLPPGENGLLPFSSGSGFVWDAAGHIVTNFHVVEGAEQVQITFSDGTMSIAEIVGTDEYSDLAVLKIDPEGYVLVPVDRGKIDDVFVGMRVAAIGNPFSLRGTLTSGIVSAIGRSIPSLGSFNIPDSIQTDAAINPGNSGGPLLNEQGEVIGVNAQIRSETRANSGVGFAIPIVIVERVVPSLIDAGRYEHSYMGVSGQTFSPICSDDLKLDRALRGVVVQQVVRGGPAARAGLRGASQNVDTQYPAICPAGSGGDFITAIDGQPVTTFDDVLIYLERYTSPGDAVTLTVLRDGEEQGVELKLAARP